MAAIEAIAELGVTIGCKGGASYCPDDEVTAAQMELYAQRLIDKGYDITRADMALLLSSFAQAAAPAASTSRFSDTGHLPAETVAAIEAIAGLGVTLGCGDGSVYCPDDHVTAWQMMAFTQRLISSGRSLTRADMAVLLANFAETAPVGEPPESVAGGAGSGRAGTASAETVAPTVEAPRRAPLSLERAVKVAESLAPDLVVPSDCGSPPLSHPGRLPNAARAYRHGTHQGVDFFCGRGHRVEAVLDGRVVVAVGSYEDASERDLDELLAVAATAGFTPPYTLVMLYGNYVVVDHGIIDGVGHVASIYAHLEALDPSTRIGRSVRAGDTLGRVGNSGTVPAAAGNAYSAVHLHWELHVDGQYLGAGLSERETRAVYGALLSYSN